MTIIMPSHRGTRKLPFIITVLYQCKLLALKKQPLDMFFRGIEFYVMSVCYDFIRAIVFARYPWVYVKPSELGSCG